MINRRTTLLAAGALATLAHPLARAAGYPERPIKLVVGYPPGGVTDVIARILAAGLSKRLGQPVTVENRSGGNSIIATQHVATQPGDGYTLYCTYPVPYSVLPPMYKKKPVPYNPQRDYTAIAMLGIQRNGIIVRADSPFKTARQYVDFAKANPGKLTFGSAGGGQVVTLIMEALKAHMDLNIAQIPYQGSAPTIQALLGGQVDSIYLDISSTSQFIRAGQLRMLATAGKERMAAFADIPTFQEAGLPDIDLPSLWTGIVGSPGMPADIVAKLNEAINAEVQGPEMTTYFAQQSISKYVGTPAMMEQRMKADIPAWDQVVNRLGITLD